MKRLECLWQNAALDSDHIQKPMDSEVRLRLGEPENERTTVTEVLVRFHSYPGHEVQE